MHTVQGYPLHRDGQQLGRGSRLLILKRLTHLLWRQYGLCRAGSPEVGSVSTTRRSDAAGKGQVSQRSSRRRFCLKEDLRNVRHVQLRVPRYEMFESVAAITPPAAARRFALSRAPSGALGLAQSSPSHHAFSSWQMAVPAAEQARGLKNTSRLLAGVGLSLR
jgi:hypothetical protein